jgi:hypothetical protein
MCGKALPFRAALPDDLRLRLKLFRQKARRSLADEWQNKRKGKAFPHIKRQSRKIYQAA